MRRTAWRSVPTAALVLILFITSAQAEKLSAWSDLPKSINNPPTRYLLPEPLTGLGRDVLATRLFKVVLAVTAVCVAIVASSQLLPTRLGWSVFALLAACFTKAAAIGGKINNDNLAAAADAAVIAGVAGSIGGAGGAAWWLAGGLAPTGRSRLTAPLALGSIVAPVRLRAVARCEERLWCREHLMIGSGAPVTLIPWR